MEIDCPDKKAALLFQLAVFLSLVYSHSKLPLFSGMYGRGIREALVIISGSRM
jgi:hypothetical protein